MSEPSKMLDGAIAFLRSFPLRIRLSALICLLVPFVVILRGRYDWPNWPVHSAPGLNMIGMVFLVAALFIIVSYSPDPVMSVADLPETKPVFADSLTYFKTGPKREGRRGELLKVLQNAYVTDVPGNKYLLPEALMMECQTSPWDFDRIAFYLFERYKANAAPEKRINRVNYEIALLDTRGWKGTLVPLHYAVESVYPGLFRDHEPAPSLLPTQLEPFRKILDELDSGPARLGRLFKGPRGKGIIKNCRDVLIKSSGITALSIKA